MIDKFDDKKICVLILKNNEFWIILIEGSCLFKLKSLRVELQKVLKINLNKIFIYHKSTN